MPAILEASSLEVARLANCASFTVLSVGEPAPSGCGVAIVDDTTTVRGRGGGSVVWEALWHGGRAVATTTLGILVAAVTAVAALVVVMCGVLWHVALQRPPMPCGRTLPLPNLAPCLTPPPSTGPCQVYLALTGILDAAKELVKLRKKEEDLQGKVGRLCKGQAVAGWVGRARAWLPVGGQELGRGWRWEACGAVTVTSQQPDLHLHGADSTRVLPPTLPAAAGSPGQEGGAVQLPGEDAGGREAGGGVAGGGGCGVWRHRMLGSGAPREESRKPCMRLIAG